MRVVGPVPLASTFVLVATVGCFEQAVDPASPIACSTEQQCPTAWRCVAELGRCVPVDGEAVDPTLTSTTPLAPAFATRGTRLTLSFTPSEALAAVRVELVLPDDSRRPMSPTETTAFSYVIGPDDPTGAWEAFADLVDGAGNTARIAVGSTVVDVDPPTLAEPASATPPVIQAATTEETIVLVFNEAIASATLQATRGADIVVATPVAGDARWTFTFDPAALADGTWNLAVDAVDLAGNHGTPDLALALVVDRTAPTATVADAPADSRAGDTVRFSLQVNEPVFGAPRVDNAGPLVFAVDGVGTSFLRASAPVRADDDGTWAPTLTGLADAAGNPLAPITTAAFRVDTHAPTLVNATMTPQAQGIDVSFGVDEALGAPPTVSVGVGESCDLVDGAPAFRFRCALADVELADVPVVVGVSDVLGNAVSAPIGTVTIDTRAPRLDSAALTPSAGLGGVLSLALRASETLGAAPILGWRGNVAPPLEPPDVIATRASFSHIVGRQDADGVFVLDTVTLVDVAGNTTVETLLPPLTLVVDATPPAPVVAEVGGARVHAPTPGHDIVDLTVTGLAPDDRVELSVAGAATACDVVSDAERLCSYTVSGAEGDLIIAIVVVTDRGGNVTATPAAIQVDRTPPLVRPESVVVELLPGPTNPLPAVAALTVGSRVRLTFQSTELGAAPRVDLDGVPLTLTSSIGTTFVAEHVLAAQEVGDGDATLAVRLEDELGNVSVTPLPQLVAIDTSPPAPFSGPRNDGLMLVRDGAARSVRATAGDLLEAGAFIVVTSDAGLEIGRGAARADGGFDAVTLSQPVLSVRARQVDAAGNASALEPLHLVDFVARNSATGLTAGRRRALLDDRDPDRDELVGLGAVTAAGRFEQTAFTVPTNPRALLVEDGGDVIALADGGLFRFDGARWRPTTGHAAPPTGQIIGAIGGAFDSVEVAATFAEEVVPAEVPPPFGPFESETRRSCAATRRQRLGDVVSDEAGVPCVAGATFLRDGAGELLTLGGWSLIREFVFEPSSFGPFLESRNGADPPSPRLTPGAALDDNRDVVVVYGGNFSTENRAADSFAAEFGPSIQAGSQTRYPPGGDIALGDTWERAADGTWQEVLPDDPEGDGNPPPLVAPTLTFDPVTGETLLFDGALLWAWTGASWHIVATSDVEGDGEPSAFGPMTFDPIRDAVVMLSDALWVFRGASWERLGPTSVDEQPGVGTLLPTPGPLLLFDGRLWQLTDAGWRLVPAADPEGDGDPVSPIVAPWRSNVDPSVELAAVDLVDGALWTWSGASWRNVGAPAPFFPQVLVDLGDGLLGALADDAPGAGALFDGQDWSGPFLLPSSGRIVQAAVVNDALAIVMPQGFANTVVERFGSRLPEWPSGDVVLVSGFDESDLHFSPCDDSDPFDFPAVALTTARDGHELLFGGRTYTFEDIVRGRFDFCTRVQAFPHTVRRDGVDLEVGDPELDGNPGLGFFTAAFDPGRGGVMLFDGTRSVWRFDDGAGDRPAVIVRVQPEVSGLPPGGLVGVDVEVGVVGAPSIVLAAWDPAARRWTDVASTSAPTATVSFNGGEVTPLRPDPREPMRIACVGPDGGSVDVGAAAVHLRFRVP